MGPFLLHVDVLTQKMKPRTRSIVVCAPSKTVTDRLKALFGKVVGDIKDIE
jgi:aspartokinase